MKPQSQEFVELTDEELLQVCGGAGVKLTTEQQLLDLQGNFDVDLDVDVNVRVGGSAGKGK